MQAIWNGSVSGIEHSSWQWPLDLDFLHVCPVSSFHNQGFLPLGPNLKEWLLDMNNRLGFFPKQKPLVQGIINWCIGLHAISNLIILTGLLSQDKMVNFPENY